MTNQMNQMNRQQLFNLINTVSFAVDDLLLFLDTHPDDAEAIKSIPSLLGYQTQRSAGLL